MASPFQILTDRFLQIGDVQRQSFLHFGTSITVTVLGFLSTMAITHLTGSPDVPGGYFLFLAYLGIFSLISSGGLGGATVNLMGSGDRRVEIFSTYLMLRIILLLCSIILLVFLGPALVDLTTAGLLPWLIAGVVATACADIAGTWLYATGKAGYIQISSLINNLVRIITQVLTIVTGFGVAGLAGSVIAGLVIGSLYLIPLCHFRPGRFSQKSAEELIRFSFWTLLASGGMIIYGNIDTILLGYFGSTNDVGLYRIALQLASFALFSALALNTILYPKFSSWQHDERREWIAGSLARAVSYSLLLALPVCIGGMILGNRLLYFLYGSPYQVAGFVLALLLITQVAYVFVFLWTMTLNALGMPKSSAVPALIATAVNIPLNLILIPIFGINGAGAAVLITVLIHVVCVGWILSKYIGLIPDLRALRSICIATLCMAVIVGLFVLIFPLTHVLLLAGCVLFGAVSYLLTLAWLERGIDTALGRMMKEMGLVLPEWL
ncbi:MAG: flippase [Methanobacteriota archaeon]